VSPKNTILQLLTPFPNTLYQTPHPKISQFYLFIIHMTILFMLLRKVFGSGEHCYRDDD